MAFVQHGGEVGVRQPDADPGPGQAVRLGQGAQDYQIRVISQLVCLGVVCIKLDIGFVHNY